MRIALVDCRVHNRDWTQWCVGELSQIYLKSKDDTKLDCINYNSVRFSNSDGLHCHVTFKQFTSTYRVKGPEVSICQNPTQPMINSKIKIVHRDSYFCYSTDLSFVISTQFYISNVVTIVLEYLYCKAHSFLCSKSEILN